MKHDRLDFIGLTLGNQSTWYNGSRLSGFLFDNERSIIILYVTTAIVVSFQTFLAGPWKETSLIYNQYNNYIIFKQSWLHLIHHQDLYAKYAEEYYDLFKYSPTFAMFFGLFSFLPDRLGLIFWNLLNAVCLSAAVLQLPQMTRKSKVSILIFVMVEMTIALQNSQSNALIAGLIILAFTLLEKDRYFFAALCIVASAFIKIFGLLAFVLFLFYPRKGRLLVYSALVTISLALLPLLFISFSQLKFLYTSWYHLLMEDYSNESGLSMMGWLATWFNWTIDTYKVVLAGLFVFLIPLVHRKLYTEDRFRLFMLSSLLIWVIIFNHMAESPSYVIAMSGVGIWFYSGERTTINWILVTLAFIFTSLSQTDIFSARIQDRFIDPYVVKAVPCILVWLKITFDALWNREDKIAMQAP